MFGDIKFGIVYDEGGGWMKRELAIGEGAKGSSQIMS